MIEDNVVGSSNAQIGQIMTAPMTGPSGPLVGPSANPNSGATDNTDSGLVDRLLRQLELLDWEIDITNQYIAGLYNDLQYARETYAFLVARMTARTTSQLDMRSISQDVASLERQMAVLKQLIAEQESHLTRLLAEHDRLERELAEIDTGGQTPLGIPIDG